MSIEGLFSEIRVLEDVNSLSKHEKLVKGIINAIDQKLICRGDMLPSVNQMNKEFNYARETIVKAYKELITSCLLYTSPSPRDRQKSRMPSSA